MITLVKITVTILAFPWGLAIAGKVLSPMVLNAWGQYVNWVYGILR